MHLRSIGLLFLALALPTVAACERPAEVENGLDTATEALAPSCHPPSCSGDACGAFDETEDMKSIAPLPPNGAPKTVTPEPPLLRRRVKLGQKGQYIRPSIPAWRTTPDGRIALVGGEGLGFATVQAERLREQPLVKAPNDIGANIFGKRTIIPSKFVHPSLPPTSTMLGTFLCAPSLAQPVACGATKDEDCYDLRLIQEVDITGPAGDQIVFESIPVHVRVTSPKTLGAQVTSVEFEPSSAWEVSPILPIQEIFEPMASADGRLFAGRLNPANPAETYRLNDKSTHKTDFSLLYAYSETPCGVSNWAAITGDVLESIRPIPAAPFDDRLKDKAGAPKYGIAAYPVRDAFGNPLGEDGVLSGSYPWIDRFGSNLVFSTIETDGIRVLDDHSVATRFPMKRLGGSLQALDSPPRGFSMIGSWTQGKAVMLDDLINNEDYGLQSDDTHQFELYENADGPIGVLANGGGRNGQDKLDLPNVKGNGHHVESQQNAFGYHQGGQPVTPRDVVWNVTRGLASEEVAFDDSLDPYLVVYAPMNAATTNGQTVKSAKYNDGFAFDGKAFTHDAGDIRVQNAAASAIYPLPDAGRLEGDARIEPVALGGISGRGLWLENDARLRFDLPSDLGSAVGDASFYVGVFVDVHEALAGRRHVFSIDRKDGATTSLFLDDGAVATVRNGAEEVQLDISCSIGSWVHRWHHIGALFEASGKVVVFIDGNPIGKVHLTSPEPLARGKLVFGGAQAGASGLTGWIDEARLEVEGGLGQLSHQGSVELLCNYARGTMVGVGPSSPLRDRADDAIYARARAKFLGVTWPKNHPPLCATNYRSDYAIGRNLLPADTISLREPIIREGGPLLRASTKRADTRGNSFCRSCHLEVAQDPHRPPPLQESALTEGSALTPLDPRTQPMQPMSFGAKPAFVRGVIPKGFIHGPTGPAPDAKTEGPEPVLQWVLPP